MRFPKIQTLANKVMGCCFHLMLAWKIILYHLKMLNLNGIEKFHKSYLKWLFKF